jgi:hypothetical protein
MIFLHVYVIHSAALRSHAFVNCRMVFKLLTDSLFIAIYRSNWLHSRKYGTVWYHPASSRFYLTIFILCQFQGKLTGTIPDSTPGPRV